MVAAAFLYISRKVSDALSGSYKSQSPALLTAEANRQPLHHTITWMVGSLKVCNPVLYIVLILHKGTYIHFYHLICGLDF